MRPAQLTLLLVVFPMAVGCARSLSGSPVAGDGVRMKLRKAHVSGQSVEVELEAANDLEEAVYINRNQIAVVDPKGASHYRTGRRETVKIKPGKDKRVKVEVEDTGVNWDFVKGLYLRFDGVWQGTRQISVPPMALGSPDGSPGQSALTVTAPEDAVKDEERARKKASRKSISRKAKDAVFGESVEEYSGARRGIKEQGAKIAALPLQGSADVSKDITEIMDEYLLAEFQKAGFEAIGPDDINAMLGLESLKDTVQCDDDSCIAEIGNALGVPYLAAGKVANMGGSMVVTVKLLDVQNTKVLSRANRHAEGGMKVLPRIIAEAVQELIASSDL